MGVVFAAEDTKLGRTVAIKFLQPRLAVDETARARFINEARAMAAIRHAGVVTVYDVSGDEWPYLVMELLDGESLAARIDRLKRLPPAEVTRIGRQIAEGLAAAHQIGLLHRDIKPANIWIEAANERCTLLDFGLARGLDGPTDLTERGVLLGTPAFMSPEQAAGLELDGRSDLFSLGSVLYLLATGRLPFEGTNPMATLSALAQGTPTPAHVVSSAVPSSLSDLLMRLLAKDPGERPASSAVLVEELRRLELTLAAPENESSVGNRQHPALANVVGEQGTGRTQRSTWRKAFVGIAFFAFICGTIVVIRSKDGTKIEIPLPEGATAQIVERADGPSTEGVGAPAISLQSSPLEALRREDIPPYELAMAGQGDPLHAPAELVAVLGDSRLKHWGRVLSASFHPDGSRLATAANDGVRVWDFSSGEQRFASGTEAHGNHSLATYSPDGRWLAWLRFNGKHYPGYRDIVLSDANTGMVRATLTGHQDRVTALAFNANGTELASASADGWVKLWSVAAAEPANRPLHAWNIGKPVDEHVRPTELHAVLFLPGSRLLVGSWKRDVIEILDTATGERVGELREMADFLTLNADGTRLATHAGRDIQIWDATTLTPLRKIPQANFRAMLFHPQNPDWLILAGRLEFPQTGFALWSLSQNKVLRRVATQGLDGQIDSVALTQDGRVMAVGGFGGVQLWNTETWQEIQLPARSGHAGAVTDVVIGADQRVILTSGTDGVVLRWNLQALPLRADPIFKHKHAVTSLALDESGKTLAIGTRNRETVLLDLRGSTPSVTATMKGELVSQSRDASKLLLRRENMPVVATSNGAELRRITDPAAASGLMALSPDGQLVAITTRVDPKVQRRDGPTRIWNTATGEFIGEIPAILDLQPLAFSPDNKRMITASNPNVGVYEIPSGKRLHSWNHGQTPVHAALTPHGNLVAVATYMGTIRLWDTRTGELVRELHNTGASGLQPSAQRLTFSSDARYVFTANANGTAYVLRLP
jgi:WD40 repeat protein